MKKNAKAKWNSEQSLSQLLSDPLVHSLMAADGVDPAELREELREKARDLPHTKTSSSKGFLDTLECRC